jgi:anti-sigma factor RsiW
MRMTNCTSIDALITPFVDDALGAADRERVDLHLRACPACERRLIAEREARQARRPPRSRRPSRRLVAPAPSGCSCSARRSRPRWSLAAGCG